MADPAATVTDPPPRGFPFVTVLATFAVVFAFLGVTILMYRSPNYLGETPREPASNPPASLEELRAKNQAVLEGQPGSGAKKSVNDAASKLLGQLKSEKDTLPFPTPEPPAPSVVESKKK